MIRDKYFKKNRYKHILISSNIFVLIITLYFFFPWSKVFFYWDMHYLLDRTQYINYFSSFLPNQSLGVYGVTSPWIIYYLLPFIINNPAVSQLFYLALLSLLAFNGFYRFLGTMEVSFTGASFVKVVLSIIYVFNVNTFFNVFNNILPQILFWAILPLNLVLFTYVIEKRRLKHYLLYFGSIIFIIGSFSHPAMIVNYLFCLGVLSIIKGVIEKKKGVFRLLLINFLTLLPLFVQYCLNSLSVIERTYGSVSESKLTLLKNFFLVSVDRFKMYNILSGLFNWGLFSDSFFFNNRYLLILLLIPIVFFTIGITFRTNSNRQDLIKEKFYLLMFLLIAGISTLFIGPFRDLFYWLYDLIPQLFLMFRYFDHKFGYIFMFFYLIFIFLVLRNVPRRIIILIVTTLLLVFNLSFFFVRSPNFDRWNKINIPSDYYLTCEKIKEISSRSLKLPYAKNAVRRVTLNESIYEGNDILSEICNHPIVNYPSHSFSVEREFYKFDRNILHNKPANADALDFFGIDSIVIDKTFIPSEDYLITSYRAKEKYLSNIRNLYSENIIYEDNVFIILKLKKIYLIEANELTITDFKVFYLIKFPNINKKEVLNFKYIEGDWVLVPFNIKSLKDISIKRDDSQSFFLKWIITVSSESSGKDLSFILFYLPDSLFYSTACISLLCIVLLFSKEVRFNFKKGK